MSALVVLLPCWQDGRERQSGGQFLFPGTMTGTVKIEMIKSCP